MSARPRTPTIRITLACECGRWFTLSGTRAGYLVSCPSCRRHAFSPIAGEPYEGHFTRITPDFTAWTVHHAARCTTVLALVAAVLGCWVLAYLIQGGKFPPWVGEFSKSLFSSPANIGAW